MRPSKSRISSFRAVLALFGVASLVGTGTRWSTSSSKAFVAAAAAAATTSNDESSASVTATLSDDDGFVCSLYLAPSSKSKSDDFQWGTYTAVTLESGDRIGPETLAIPLYNFRANNRRSVTMGAADASSSSSLHSSYWEHLSTHVLNFMWQAEMGGADNEQIADDTDPLATCLAMPGPAMSAAFDPPTKSANADWDVAAAYHRTSLSSVATAGVAHPNRAATTPFDKVTLRATKTIPAGSEVMVAYDDPIASPPSKEQADEHAITEDDFAKMDETISQMVVFFDKHSALDDSAKLQIYQFLIQDFMEAAVGAVKARKVAEIMPPSPMDLRSVQMSGGIKSYANSTATLQKQRVEWLRQTGYCLDHVRPAPSTIPHAGWGAFATHRLSEGSVITPVPMLQIPDSSALDMFDLIEDKTTGMWSRDPSAYAGKQLLTNYVFGHPKSTMVFLPASSSIAYVNHGDKPNAKLRWADGSQVGHTNAEWMATAPQTMVEVDKFYTVGLLMELVALRDIEPGEEITIYYGEEWKRAWDAHQKSWRETAPKTWPLRAADLNARHLTAAFPTESELEDVADESMSYPDGVSLKAFLMIDEEADETAEGTEQHPYRFKAPSTFGHLGTSTLFDVEVLDRISTAEGASVDSVTYIVRVEYEDEVSYVYDVPHHAFVFVDDAESGDQFVEGIQPFRHYIGIPDDVFPQGPWRNK